MLDIKPPIPNEVHWTLRVPQKLDDKVEILVRKHKVPKSTVIRSLIEAGLKNV